MTGKESDPGIAKSIHAKASADEVFRQVSTAEGFRHWWCKNVSGSDAPGGELVLKFTNEFWRVSLAKAQSPSRAEWAVLENSEKKELAGTTVIFDIEPKGAHLSEVRVLHAGLTPSCTCYGPCDGAWTYLMGSLKNYLETGKGGAV
jgi:uncharacterized protein YndB with AHSA1/START domain